MSLVLHTTRYGLRAFARNRKARLLTLFFPLLLLVIFEGIFNQGKVAVNGVQVDYGVFFAPSVIVFTLTTTTLAMLISSVVSQRELGILKRRRATPLPASAIASVAVLLLVAGVVFGTTVPLAGVPTLIAGVLFGSAAFCGLAYALSTIVDSADSAQPLIQLVMFPLFFISGVWVPTSQLPDWLQTVASIFPVEHVADLVHRSFVGAVGLGPVLTDIGALVLWTVVGARIAAARFGWMPSRKG